MKQNRFWALLFVGYFFLISHIPIFHIRNCEAHSLVSPKMAWGTFNEESGIGENTRLSWNGRVDIFHSHYHFLNDYSVVGQLSLQRDQFFFVVCFFPFYHLLLHLLLVASNVFIRIFAGEKKVFHFVYAVSGISPPR